MSRLQDSRARPFALSCTIAVALLASTACEDSAGGAPTFRGEVASIIHRNCADCHRPGEAGPFSLLTYEDCGKRAKQIGIVVDSGFMPPWLPLPDHGGPFLGERRLAPEDAATLRAWIEAGAPEGSGPEPEPPAWTDGWQLGEPDLVVQLAQPYELPAEGIDVYRNFVIRLPLQQTRFVRAVELRPDNRFVLHHAVMRIDRTRSCRRLDRRDPGPGFGGMAMGRAEVPDGHFLGWAPGKVAFEGYDDMAWRLDPGNDLVLQMHLRPSGKPEKIQPSIGFTFRKAGFPPLKAPVALTLANLDIDIPAGEANYTVEASYVLPVDAKVLSVYPHAHYLGKVLEGYAELPPLGENGTRRSLFRIDPWDFNWQDEYRYVEPHSLPAGSRLVMRTTFDNSANNPFNPSDPPVRVVYGEQSSDEMAELLFQLLPDRPSERVVLLANFARHTQRGYLDYFRGLVETEADKAKANNTLGLTYLGLDLYEEAVEPLRAVVDLVPDDPLARNNLATALMLAGRTEEALAELDRAEELQPGAPLTLTQRGIVHYLDGRHAEAIEALRRSLELQRNQALAHVHLGAALVATGEVEDGLAELRRGYALNPVDLRAHALLAEALHEAGKPDEAAQLEERARRIDGR